MPIPTAVEIILTDEERAALQNLDGAPQDRPGVGDARADRAGRGRPVDQP
jgi:hypothetical protein